MGRDNFERFLARAGGAVFLGERVDLRGGGLGLVFFIWESVSDFFFTIADGRGGVKNFFAIEPLSRYNEWLWVAAVSYFAEGSY